MDAGKYSVDMEDLSIASFAMDELEGVVASILEEDNENLDNGERRTVVSRRIVTSIIRRISGVEDDGGGE